MSSRHEGFTIVEAMLAVAIVVMMLTPLLSIENFSIRSIGKARNRISNYIFAQDFMMQARRDQSPESQSYTANKKENPNTVYTYTLQSVPAVSALKSQENLLLERVEIKSPENKTSEYLVNFVYKKPKQTV